MPQNSIAMGLDIQMFGAYDAGIDFVFPHSCPSGFIAYTIKGLLEIYKKMIEIMLM